MYVARTQLRIVSPIDLCFYIILEGGKAGGSRRGGEQGRDIRVTAFYRGMQPLNIYPMIFILLDPISITYMRRVSDSVCVSACLSVSLSVCLFCLCFQFPQFEKHTHQRSAFYRHSLGDYSSSKLYLSVCVCVCVCVCVGVLLLAALAPIDFFLLISLDMPWLPLCSFETCHPLACLFCMRLQV